MAKIRLPRFSLIVSRYAEENAKWKWSINDNWSGGCTAEEGSAWNSGYDHAEEAVIDGEKRLQEILDKHEH